MSVYFIQAGGPEGAVKIGKANFVPSRCAQFQAVHYEQLKVIRVIVGGTKEERALHRRFVDLHIRGEWFRFHPDMLTAMPDLSLGTAPCPWARQTKASLLAEAA